MKNIILSLICGLLGAMVFTVAQSYLHSRPIAVVRMDDIIASHLKTYGEKALTESQRKALSEQFAQSLDPVIQQVADQQRVTLLVSPAVVSNVPDYTDAVMDEVGRIIDGE